MNFKNKFVVEKGFWPDLNKGNIHESYTIKDFADILYKLGIIGIWDEHNLFVWIDDNYTTVIGG